MGHLRHGGLERSDTMMAMRILLLLLLACLQWPAAHAQGGRVEGLDQQRAKTEQELTDLRQAISLSAEMKASLEAEVARLDEDTATITRTLIETSTRSRAIEERIERAANRLEELRVDEAAARQSLQERRGVLIEIVAALQRMGHKPPPALLVTPEDALNSVRSAILLGAVLPGIREETTILATELGNLVRIREEISASREKLSSDMTALAEEERRLSLLFEQKKKLIGEKQAELARQTAQAAELAGKATNLETLIEDLNREITSVQQAQEAARRAEEERLKQEEQRIAEARESATSNGFDDLSRIAPAMAFADAKGLLPKPVAGVDIAGFNQKTASGEISKGLSIATRSGSRVLSPTDGWVIYAGPFRSYGQLLIVNAGNGYHVVMAGMERIDAVLGQFVLAGEPIGAMGETRVASNVNVDIGTRRPVLYVEFRKDGVPIDSAPWWARTNLKESSG
ncbi:murein hydrolase activator EnvC family protein [Salaquimonas pukyongi]|uniref:murein hydrolase activator EnvC family protein n=1 Tax=Salaquimonas pukyongi TaxID=2712698 RepID=UPI0009FB6CEB|nr:murein hydrolase activator EnvC [Salaquimonas pukyongi]